MRDYLYIWNDPINQRIIASGIEFRDIAGNIGLNGGILLLERWYKLWAKYVQNDPITRFEYVSREHIHDLAKEDIEIWGDFAWVDYVGDKLSDMSDHEIAELLFFAHSSRPLGDIALSCLGNKYLCYIHDDGWFFQLFYSCWEDVESLLGKICSPLDLNDLRPGTNAYWISGSSVEIEERTMNPDIILNRRYHKRRG